MNASADFRPLKVEELDLVAGGEDKVPVHGAVVVDIPGKGTLFTFYIRSYGYSLPVAQWHPMPK